MKSLRGITLVLPGPCNGSAVLDYLSILFDPQAIKVDAIGHFVALVIPPVPIRLVISERRGLPCAATLESLNLAVQIRREFHGFYSSARGREKFQLNFIHNGCSTDL